jgi:membrane protease YdiL (CAAX protease family)
VAVSLIVPLIAGLIWLVPRIIAHPAPVSPEDSDAWKADVMALANSPTSMLIQVISIIPAHILTVAFCWVAVTNRWKRPFFESIGWHWTISPAISKAAPLISRGLIILLLVGIALALGQQFRQPETTGVAAWVYCGALGITGVAAIVFYMLLDGLQRDPNSKAAVAIAKASYVVGVLFAVLVISIVLERVLPNKENTVFDILIKSSPQARIWIALLAVFTAPVVEELVYRGVLYSSLRPRVGLNWAVAIVTLLFSAVHFPQYWGAWGGLAGLTLLSLALTVVRASTRSIFPCIVIHTLNNLVAAIQILSIRGTS